MIKKIALTALFILFAGLLIYGAINRTAASAQQKARPAANGSGAAQATSSSAQAPLALGSQGQNQQRQGQGRNANEDSQAVQGQGAAQRGQGRPNALEQLTISGTVVQAPQLGVDIILETDQGRLSIGTGPGYLTQQGFLIGEGDSLIIDGFWEDDLFKPVKITREADGEAIVLRDEWGRPMWSGSRRNGRNGPAAQDGL